MDHSLISIAKCTRLKSNKINLRRFLSDTSSDVNKLAEISEEMISQPKTLKEKQRWRGEGGHPIYV